MEQRVNFRNNRQQKLAGILELPSGTGPFSCIVLVHGFAADKNMFFFPKLAKELVSAGFAVLRFDARGCGESEGDIHPSYLTLTADVEAAVKFLLARDDIGHIGLAGHSMGGTACMLAAQMLPSVQAVVTYGAVADTEKSATLKRSEAVARGEFFEVKVKSGVVRLDHSFFDDAREVQLFKTVAALHKPLLLVHGVDDKRVGIEQGTQLFIQASMPKSFKKIAGCDHWFVGHEESLCSSTVDFFTMWLRTDE